MRSTPEYLAEHARSLIARLASGEPDPELGRQLATWRTKPFNPHALARLRTSAFRKAVVMKYLDNLIAWGDRFFRLGTLESLTEAARLYKLAAYILGERPEPITSAGASVPETLNSLVPRNNVLVSVENTGGGRRRELLRAMIVNLISVYRPCSTSVHRRTTSFKSTGTSWQIGCSTRYCKEYLREARPHHTAVCAPYRSRTARSRYGCRP